MYLVTWTDPKGRACASVTHTPNEDRAIAAVRHGQPSSTRGAALTAVAMTRDEYRDYLRENF